MSRPGTESHRARLGFAVKVLGQPELKSHDTRRWQSGPHLRVSIACVDAILDYLDRHDIRMYRMSSDFAPYATHPAMPQFHNQVAECRSELETLGRRSRELDIRLSFHPSQFVLLNSRSEGVVEQSIRDLILQAEILDVMGLGPEAVLVLHAGAVNDDRAEGSRRWAECYERLPEPVRRRLVLENDDLRYSAADVLAIHERTGVPLIFDHQHYWCHNPESLELRAALERFVRSWPDGVRPKVHFSSPRTELREVRRKNRTTGKAEVVLQEPLWTGHADFVNPFEFITFLRQAEGLAFDVMLEAKSKDLALLRLRRDLARYAPEFGVRFRGVPEGPASPDSPTTPLAEQAVSAPLE